MTGNHLGFVIKFSCGINMANTNTVNIISENKEIVKNEASVFFPEAMNDALVGTNISGASGRPMGTGESTLAKGLPSNTSWAVLSEKPNLSNQDNLTHVDNLSDGFPSCSDSLDLTNPNNTNCYRITIPEICEDFDKHIACMIKAQKIFLHLQNEKEGLEALCMIDRMTQSRYFPEGRDRIRRKIQKRIRNYEELGIYQVFTVDVKRYSVIEAWDSIWDWFKLWRDDMNAYRGRHMNARGCLRYVAVLEQHKSGYPHLNVFFPGLRVLIKKADFHKVTDYWRMGNVETEKERKPQSACSYILKYISKMEGWERETFAILWYYRIRMWNMSHCLYEKKQVSGWKKIGKYKSDSFEHLASHFGVNDIPLDSEFILVKKP